jgi:molybdopterin synthase catalytic subunit
MKMKYGYEIEDWDLAKAEVKDLLIQRAKLRGMMPYSELTTKVRTIELEPNSQALAAMLGQVSEEEDDAGRGLLTVIVVHKVGDMQPGPGFFELAKKRGRNPSDILKCWIDELKKVHGAWATTSRC